jgi:hypothetical protein
MTDEIDYYGKHAYMLVNGFAINAHTGEPAYTEYAYQHDRSRHASGEWPLVHPHPITPHMANFKWRGSENDEQQRRN